MFGDKYAVAKAKELIDDFGVKTVVETGTYKADGTLGFSALMDNVYSIEIQPHFFEESKTNVANAGYDLVASESREDTAVFMKGKKKITLILGNSPEVIKKIINKLPGPILFFLDAHWLEYWPLKDEIRAIKPRPDSLIIVHDIKVPGKDFGYDTYIPGTALPIGPACRHFGTALDYEYIKDDLAFVNPNYKIFYNEKAAGDPRGILYAVPVPKVAEQKRGMRVLVVSTMIFPCGGDMRYGGIERLVYHIASELNRRGYQVSVAAPQGSHFPKGIEHINTGPCGDFVESERKAYWGFSHRLKEFDTILEMSHTHWCMIENELPAIAFIWHDPFIMKPLEPSYNICALSWWQANRFRQVYGYETIVLDPHCGETREPKASNGRFLFIGKMGPQKGALEAIGICRELGVPLDVVGGTAPGDPPEYLEQVKASCHGEIVYHGEVDDDTKFTLLEQAKALIYPISYPSGQGEAHSHKIVDTLLCGCPVVTYNVGAFSEVIENGVTGFLANSEEEFKTMMMKVDTLDKKLIRKKAVGRWSVEATVDRIVPVLERVANGERWGNIRRVSSGPTIVRPSATAAGYVTYSLKDYPRQIRLDTINACNAKCIPCHLNFQKRPHGQMSMELLTKVLDELKGWAKPLEEIVPVNFGELLLHKEWYQILKLIEERLPQTRMALPTNGSLLDDEAVRQLASISTLKWVNFSLNAFFRETYEAFTGLKAETIDRIKRASELLRSLRPDIVTCASMIFDTSFQTELERDLFVQFWQPLVSVVSINPAAYCNSPLKKPLIPVKTACRSIFDGLTILYDGTVVTGCCFDASGVLKIGDVNTLPLLYIWRGERLRELCKLHNQGRRGEIELCSRCTFS